MNVLRNQIRDFSTFHCKHFVHSTELPNITVARTQVSGISVYGKPHANSTQLPTILPVRMQHKAPSEYCGKDQIFSECSKKKKFSDAYCRPGAVEVKKVKKCIKRRGNYKKKR